MTRRRSQVVVRDEPEDALLRSARALRRMGGRLTRFDVEALTLEARLARWGLELVVTVHGIAAGGGATRLTVECARGQPGRGFAFGLARLTIARFRSTLAATDPSPGEGR